MNITAKRNLSFNADKKKMDNFDKILKLQIYDPSYNFGLWTVNKKSDKSVTLHSEFLEMSYE